MKEVNKYLLELMRAINHFTAALEDGEKWMNEDGEEMWVRLTKEVIPRPLVFGWSLRCEDILDEICQAGKDNIPFFVERLKDKGILWIKCKVEQYRNINPRLGGKYGEELVNLRERINEMSAALFATVRRAEEMVKAKKSILDNEEHDIEKMRGFFNDKFNGREGQEIDHFQFDFLPAWRSKRNLTKKDYARIAYMIHINMRWTTPKVRRLPFKDFCKDFCAVAGCSYSEEYKPNKLRDDLGGIPDTFYFLKNR